jgi:putative redox protein
LAERSDVELVVDGNRLSAYLTAAALPASDKRPGLLLIHGFPSKQRPGEPSRAYELLAERIADELEWSVLAISLRGCGRSEGQFSLEGWLTDVEAGVAHLRETLGLRDVWLFGSTTGGSLALLVGAADTGIAGVATVAARSDFDDWAAHPEEFLGHCRDVGVITSDEWPPSLEEWARPLGVHRAVDAIENLADRPVLILHGSDDFQVPSGDARRLAEAHGDVALRIVSGGDHRLRHDPRAVAVLLGWLADQTPRKPAAGC